MTYISGCFTTTCGIPLKKGAPRGTERRKKRMGSVCLRESQIPLKLKMGWELQELKRRLDFPVLMTEILGLGTIGKIEITLPQAEKSA